MSFRKARKNVSVALAAVRRFKKRSHSIQLRNVAARTVATGVITELLLKIKYKVKLVAGDTT